MAIFTRACLAGYLTQFLPGFVVALFLVNEKIQSYVVGRYVAGFLTDVCEKASVALEDREWAFFPSDSES